MLGWWLVVGGVVWYFVWSAVGTSIFRKRSEGFGTPTPGAGDVPGWVSGLALLGGVAVIIGVIVLIAG